MLDNTNKGPNNSPFSLSLMPSYKTHAYMHKYMIIYPISYTEKVIIRCTFSSFLL